MKQFTVNSLLNATDLLIRRRNAFAARRRHSLFVAMLGSLISLNLGILAYLCQA